MSSAQQMVNRFTVREFSLIKKLCEPLHNYLDVRYFWYSHTTADGGHFSIGSNVEMHEYYFVTKLFVHSPFFHDPKFIQPGFYSYRSVQDSKFQDSLDSCVNKLNVNLATCLAMKRGKELMRFGYAGDPKLGDRFNERIINNLALLKKFNSHFLAEIQPMLRSIRNHLVDLPSELGADYHLPPKGLQRKATHHDKIQFLDDIGILNAKDVLKLSPRELECLKHLHEGLSFKEIGDVLMLSNRTVEAYLENSKNKLNCFSKLDLFRIAEQLDSCGYFD
jgi:DNA-binding CsgD family transcriptional regulator